MSGGQKNWFGSKGVGYHWHREAPAFLGNGFSIRVWRLALSVQFRGSEKAQAVIDGASIDSDYTDGQDGYRLEPHL